MLPHALEIISCSRWSSVLGIDALFEVRFGDHLLDFMVALSIAGLSRIFVDLADLPVDFLVDFSVRIWVDCLTVGFWLVGRTCLVQHGYLPLFENLLLHLQLLHLIDCRLPSQLGSSVIVIWDCNRQISSSELARVTLMK